MILISESVPQRGEKPTSEPGRFPEVEAANSGALFDTIIYTMIVSSVTY